MKSLHNAFLSLLLCLALVLSVPTFSFAQDEDCAVSRLSVCVNGDTAASRGFCWYTKSKTDTALKIFKNGEDVSSSLSFSAPVCKEQNDLFMHKLTVSGLEKGTEYT